MPITLGKIPKLSVGDIDICSIDLQDWLDSGELFTGTPTVAEVTTTDLTLSNKMINTAALTIEGRTVAIGKAVQFKVSGQQSSRSIYRIRVTATTDASVPRTIVRDITFTAE